MRRVRNLLIAFACVGISTAFPSGQQSSRLEKIRERGRLGCGIEPGVYGFAARPDGGLMVVRPEHVTWQGFDVDVCRALAAAILGHPTQVDFIPAPSVADFKSNDAIDVVSRRLTWELRREAPAGLLFGPITFYDGQGFLVAQGVLGATAADLADKPICVAGGTIFEANLNDYFAARGLTPKKYALESRDPALVAKAFVAKACGIYTADVSELIGIARLFGPGSMRILREQISKEPLASVVRDDDVRFFDVVRWTVFVLIAAEELGITSQNIDAMLVGSKDPDVQRLLGVLPGNGKALGLDERWAYHAIKAVGNYGQIFDRHLGAYVYRGMNQLAKDGGLMYAPPLR